MRDTMEVDRPGLMLASVGMAGEGAAVSLRASSWLRMAQTILAEHRGSLPEHVADRLAFLLGEAWDDCCRAASLSDVTAGALHDAGEIDDGGVPF